MRRLSRTVSSLLVSSLSLPGWFKPRIVSFIPNLVKQRVQSRLMKLRNSIERWGWPGKIFHWLTALLIFIQIPLGIYAKEVKLSPLKFDLFVWHKSIGFVILLLTISRLLWRISGTVPTVATGTAMQQTLAKVAHGVLYVLMLLLPISGWIISSAANIPINLFWLVELPAIADPNEALKELAEAVHCTCVALLLVILALHIGAALHHHFILRDSVLKRLWF